jgi:uncharacterized tellurite resistance protein B-like protein
VRMLEGLARDDRLLLLQLLCSFAWADLQVTDAERRFVRRIASRLDASDAADVEQWLAVAPSPGSVDLSRVPQEHRRVFFEAVRALVYVDGKVDPDERASLEKLRSGLAL